MMTANVVLKNGKGVCTWRGGAVRQVAILNPGLHGQIKSHRGQISLEVPFPEGDVRWRAAFPQDTHETRESAAEGPVMKP